MYPVQPVKSPRLSSAGLKAFTITELIVTVAIVGLLAAISIPIYSNLRDDSERALANDHIEALNRALTTFSQNCWKIPTVPNDSSPDDELAVVRSLQYQFPSSSLKPGSPYFDQKYNPPASSNKSYLRIRWNGKSFELIDRGTVGTGLRFNSGADYGRDPYVFPSGYVPEGGS
jgi:prepilin-type N-terminal cleavage/methylation domain-containing protein